MILCPSEQWRNFKRRKQVSRSVSCSWFHQPPSRYRSIHTTVTIHRHWSPDCDRILKRKKDCNIKATSEEISIVSRNSPPRPRRRGKWRALRRRFVSNEARTLKSRRPARHAAVPLVLFLSCFLSRSLLTPRSLRLSSSSSFFSTSLMPDSRSYCSLSHSRCSLEPYFKNSFVLSLSCSLFDSASSSSASSAARKTRFRRERPGMRINLVCANTLMYVSAQAKTKARYDNKDGAQ